MNQMASSIPGPAKKPKGKSNPSQNVLSAVKGVHAGCSLSLEEER